MLLPCALCEIKIIFTGKLITRSVNDEAICYSFWSMGSWFESWLFSLAWLCDLEQATSINLFLPFVKWRYAKYICIIGLWQRLNTMIHVKTMSTISCILFTKLHRCSKSVSLSLSLLCVILLNSINIRSVDEC